MKNAVIVLSGGLDSTVCMSVADKDGYNLFPITFKYGQRHLREVEQACKIAAYYKCKKHLVVETGFFKDIGSSALTSRQIGIPIDRELSDLQNIPVTYVPFRNALFLSMAVGYAESLKAETVYLGVNALDYSGYPDCRPAFIEAFQKTVDTGTAAASGGKRIIIKTPLLQLYKKEIVQLGIKNNAPLHLTTSCYLGKEKACGRCDSCLLRLKGFKEAGIEDPIDYE